MRNHGNLGSYIQHRHFLADQRREIWYRLVVYRNLDLDHSRIGFSCGNGIDVRFTAT